MTADLVYDDRFASYRFGAGHPLRPERFALTVALIDSWGLLGEGGAQRLDGVDPASDDDLALVHSRDLIDAVKRASIDTRAADPAFGIGAGDTPAFLGMHEAAALSVASTIRAVEHVLDAGATRAFSPAGGMHHAHRARCAGFCIYNDCAVAIEHAVRTRAGLRVAYVDVDAHHGDGVQEAFYDRSDVLTISVHESGRYLYPGTGFAGDVGEADGFGYAVNVPMPPGAGAEQYRRVLAEVVEPAVAAFGPDLIVAQLGADSHHSDPLTQLGQTVIGFVDVVDTLVRIADASCEGRLVATGGGGYTPFDATPRMWASAFARLAGRSVPEHLPQDWIELVRATSGGEAPNTDATLDDGFVLGTSTLAEVEELTTRAIAQVRAASPLLG